MLAGSAAAQVKQVNRERRPALADENFAKAQPPAKQPSDEDFSMLDGPSPVEFTVAPGGAHAADE